MFISRLHLLASLLSSANISRPPHPQAIPLVLRDQAGSEWDYVVIEHLGTKTTLEAAGSPPPANDRDLSAWHGDTYVNGPAWADFVGDGASKSAGYVSTYCAVPGHRDQLEKMLSAPPDPRANVAGAVLLQRVEAHLGTS